MKITIDVDRFRRCIEAVRDAGMEKSGLVVLATDAGGLHARTRDATLAMQSHAGCEVVRPGSVAVEFKKLAAFLGALTTPTVTLDGNEKNLVLVSGAFRLSLSAMTPTFDMPALSQSQMNDGVEVKGETLESLLNATAYAMSVDEKRTVLCGVHLHGVDGMLVATATDGHRLARNSADHAGAERVFSQGIILPRTGATALQRLARSYMNGMVRLSLSRNRLFASTGTTTLSMLLVDGTYPDVERVIPSSAETVVEVEPRVLGGVVDRVSSVLRKERGCRMRVAGDGVELSCSDPDAGEAVESFPVPFAGDDATVTANHAYLADALRQVEDHQRVSLRFGAGERDPIHLTAGRHHAVIMPMRS